VLAWLRYCPQWLEKLEIFICRAAEPRV